MEITKIGATPPPSARGEQSDNIRNGEFIVLSVQAMHEVGAAAQTLAALYWLMWHQRSTFASINAIRKLTGCSRRTTQRHIDKLVNSGWVRRKGRQGRRTVTLELSAKAKANRAPFLPLPKAMPSELTNWGERAVYAALVRRHLLDERHPAATAVWGWHTLKSLVKETALSRRTVISARNRLIERGLVEVARDPPMRQENGRLYPFDDDIYLRLVEVA